MKNSERRASLPQRIWMGASYQSNIILQYQMASTAEKMNELMTLRSSRKIGVLEKKPEKAPESKKEVSQPPPTPLQPLPEQHKQQQLKEKGEKDSISTPNNEVAPLSNPQVLQKRFTRSSVQLTQKISSYTDMNIEPSTPVDCFPKEATEEITVKKTAQIISNHLLTPEELPENNNQTVKRSAVRPCENFLSPYNEVRKSYRKIHKKEVVSIPYRKCHDAFEGRIVAIINKIEGGKNCQKDFQGLFDRMQKIAVKDMMNRFIISGIKTIIRFATEMEIYDPKIIEKIRMELVQVEKKISQELTKMDQYESLTSSMKNQELGGYSDLKNMMIRKIYKIIKSKYPHNSVRENREKAITDCEKLFKHELNVDHLVKFIRNKMEISQL